MDERQEKEKLSKSHYNEVWKEQMKMKQCIKIADEKFKN